MYTLHGEGVLHHAELTMISCRNMFNKDTLGKMKKGAYLINTARGGICDKDAIVEALESGQLAGRPNCDAHNFHLLAHSFKLWTLAHVQAFMP